MSRADIEYADLVEHILHNGVRKNGTRGYVDTIGVFGYTYKLPVSLSAFPILTTKPISWKNIVIENLWFLSGSDRLDFLHKHNVKFWDPWLKSDGTVPSAYGHFWRKWSHTEGVMSLPPTPHKNEMSSTVGYTATIDQLKWGLEKLAKNLNTRQVCITSWDPGNVVDSTLPPCHAFHVLNVSGADNGDPALNLHLTQRSCDTALGLPYNMAGYSFLMCLYAQILGIRPGMFSHTLVDAHVYTCKEDGSQSEYDHIPGLRGQIDRSPRPAPRLEISDKIKTLSDVEEIINDATTEEILDTFKLVDYNPNPNPIRFKAAV